ncbi:MAG TPA: glycosyltransferase [Gemmatimonadaceae bacterium]|nr:glycosyltransferase [Gemmatimonadaceae bacterium]
MRLCVVSFKECWQDERGAWMTDGGFPAQMAAVGSLFDAMTLVIVRGPQREGGMPLPAAAAVVPLRRTNGSGTRRKLVVLARLPYLLRVIARHVRRADVVHTPLPGDIALIGMLVAVAYRKRLLARYCGSWNASAQSSVMYRATRASMRRIAGGRNLMMATGLGDAPPAPRMHWIFATAISAHDVQSIRPCLDRPLGHPPRLVYVGRLAPVKGLSHLVDAMGLLQRAGDDREQPVLTIIGDGPLREQLAALAHHRGCADRVCFTGQLDRRRVAEQLSQMDLCILPSLSESFCKARLDAMLCGVPVMTTAVGFGREIVGEDGERGWIVPAGSSAALADALHQAFSRRECWPALRHRCRAYAEGCTLDGWADAIARLCEQQWHLSRVNGRLRA